MGNHNNFRVIAVSQRAEENTIVADFFPPSAERFSYAVVGEGVNSRLGKTNL